MYFLLYMDDMLLTSKDIDDIRHFKELLKSKFEMKDLGSAKRKLGMEI